MRWIVKHKRERESSSGALSRRVFASKIANGSLALAASIGSYLVSCGRCQRRSNEIFSEIFGGDLLVVQTDIRTPDVIRRYVQHVNSAVLGRFPLQLVIVPILKKTKTHTSDSFAYGCSRVLMGHYFGGSVHRQRSGNNGTGAKSAMDKFRTLPSA